VKGIEESLPATREIGHPNKMTVDETLLSNAIARIVESIHPERIILFGSQARGTADERSDLDLLIIARFRGKRREVVGDLYWELRDSGLAVDIILMTQEEFESEREIPGTIARPAYLEGKIIYECPGSFLTEKSSKMD
jgi:uncharacterized protein